MKAYGVDPKDVGCCPGHDKFSSSCYKNRRSEHAKRRMTRIAHKRARARVRADLHYIMRDHSISMWRELNI